MYKRNSHYYYSSLIGLGQNVYFWIDVLDRRLDGNLRNGGGVQTGSGGVGEGFFHIGVRTVHVHSVCSGRTLPKQYPPKSDSLFVNSRTPDIGKSPPPTPPLPV